MSDPRLTSGWARVFRELFPPDRLMRERRVDIAITGDGGVRGEQVRGPLADDAAPVVDAEQVPAPDGSGYNNAKELFDALLVVADTYVNATGDTMTGDLILSDADLSAVDITATGNTTLGNGNADQLTIQGKIKFAGTSPSIAAGAAAGTSPTIALAGTDRAGLITLTVGTSPTTGELFTITFASALATANYVVMVTPADADAATEYTKVRAPHNQRATTGWKLEAVSALTASTEFVWYYVVIEYEP